MSPFPVQFTSRWDSHRSRLSYEDTVCWHLLLGGDAGVRAAAAGVEQRLARFPALHMTPPQWLHVTVQRIGPVALVTQDHMSQLLSTAQATLTGTAPVTVTLQRVLYHPEAIMLSVSPRSALAPVFTAARTATREVLGQGDDKSDDDWVPHMTLCYSAAEQPAAPVIAELGKTLPKLDVTIRELSLVVQDGPEDLWNWRVAGTVYLPGL